MQDKKSPDALLQIALERFDLASQGANDGLWDAEIDPKSPILNPSTYVWYSPRFRELLGYENEKEFPSRLETFFKHLHPDDKERILKAVKLHFEKNTTYDVEYRLKTKTGEYRWFSARGKSIRDKNGKPIRMAGSLRDITSQKTIEDALRESEERFRQIAEHIEEVFWMTDPVKNEILYISPAYEKVWGRTRESLYNEPKSFLEAIHPEDRERVIQAMSKQIHETSDEEYRVIQPNGSIRWIRDRAFPIKNRAGKIYRVAGIAEDITKSKKHQHELRLLANIVSMSVDAISTGNPDGKVTSWNKAAEAIFGFSAEEIIGKDVRDTLMPPERLYESKLTLKTNPKAVIRMRTERLHKSGRRIPVMVTTFPLIDENENVYARAGIHQDITPIVEMEKKLGEQSRMAAVGAMAAGIAHEIRNPLFGISSVAQILIQESLGNPAVKELGESMLSEIDRLNRLLKNLLLYSKPRRMEMGTIAPKELVEEFFHLHEPIKKEKHLQIQTNYDPASTPVHVDADQIRQVILNLGLNALQAAPEGSVIQVRSRVDPNESWSFEIQNRGETIPSDHLSTVFEPFFSTKTEGSGLGLSVCKKVIEDHGGTLWCESSPEKGTTFTFRVPQRLDGQA